MNITDVPGKKLDKPRYFGLPGEKLDKPKSFGLDAIESDDEEEEEQEYEEDEIQADGVDETDGAVARHGVFSQRRMKACNSLVLCVVIICMESPCFQYVSETAVLSLWSHVLVVLLIIWSHDITCTSHVTCYMIVVLLFSTTMSCFSTMR